MPILKTVRDLFPAFSSELTHLARLVERPDLAEQIPELTVVARCKCGVKSCAHFYTAPPPNGAYWPGHANLLLLAGTGKVVLGVVDQQIVAIEVLDRPDVKRLLDPHIPLPG